MFIKIMDSNWLEKNSMDKFAVWVLKGHDTVRHFHDMKLMNYSFISWKDLCWINWQRMMSLPATLWSNGHSIPIIEIHLLKWGKNQLLERTMLRSQIHGPKQYILQTNKGDGLIDKPHPWFEAQPLTRKVCLLHVECLQYCINNKLNTTTQPPQTKWTKQLFTFHISVPEVMGNSSMENFNLQQLNQN